MNSNSNQVFSNREALFVASILSIAASMGVAPIWTSAHGDAKDPVTHRLATPTPMPSFNGADRFDHSGISPADPVEPDTAGISIAAYGM